MEPVFGFALYFVSVVAVAVVAGKRGLTWWSYALACLVGGPLLVMLVGSAGGGGVAAGFGAFVIPAAALFFALSSSTDERKAVINGSSDGYIKCPFCAEAVRKEAVKCRHCGSDLTSPVAVSREHVPVRR